MGGIALIELPIVMILKVKDTKYLDACSGWVIPPPRATGLQTKTDF